jgi:hypothetical protein
MQEKKPSFEEKVNLLMEQWNELIDELDHWSKFAPPENTKKCREMVSELIAHREAARRGLLELSELNDSTSSTTVSPEANNRDELVKEVHG